MGTLWTRRGFCAATAAALSTVAPRRMFAQSAVSSVAEVERERVLREAARDVEPRNLVQFSARVAVLTAAFVLSKDEAYAGRARELLNEWMIAGETKLAPADKLGVLGLLPLAEVAIALRFLTDFLELEMVAALRDVLRRMLAYLLTHPEALLARDKSDLRGAAWLLEAAAFARALPDEASLAAVRAWFRKPAIRKQIAADGTFPEELASANPLRNTLAHFDALAGACQMLTTPFDNLWNYELEDGPGMRVVVAWLYPRVADPSQWNAVADAQFFRDVPLRRPGFLFAGRAYMRPEYVELWKRAPADVPAALAASVPMREPLLWVTRAPHGL